MVPSSEFGTKRKTSTQAANFGSTVPPSRSFNLLSRLISLSQKGSIYMTEYVFECNLVFVKPLKIEKGLNISH